MNSARKQARRCGSKTFAAAPALRWNIRLQRAATRHASDMAQNNFFDHVGSNGDDVVARVEAQGYSWQTVAENLAAGQDTADEAIEGWLRSPGHCANIMNSAVTEMAMVCVSSEKSDLTYYWTQVFGRR